MAERICTVEHTVVVRLEKLDRAALALGVGQVARVAARFPHNTRVYAVIDARAPLPCEAERSAWAEHCQKLASMCASVCTVVEGRGLRPAAWRSIARTTSTLDAKLHVAASLRDALALHDPLAERDVLAFARARGVIGGER